MRQLITNGGRSVAPEGVGMRTVDPLATADYFQEGCHHVPDTEEFLEAIGHWATSDADLLGRRDEAPSSTLQEAFADFEDGGSYEGPSSAAIISREEDDEGVGAVEEDDF
jgi:hypothetical protein